MTNNSRFYVNICVSAENWYNITQLFVNRKPFYTLEDAKNFINNTKLEKLFKNGLGMKIEYAKVIEYKDYFNLDGKSVCHSIV